MLKKAVFQTLSKRQPVSLLPAVAQRSFITYPDKNYIVSNILSCDKNAY